MTDKPIDIRTVSPEEYWKVFEKKWTSLLSYRYLGRVNSGLDTNEGAEQMALRHDMRNHSGGIMAAPLCIFSPEAGGMNDDEFVPNPVIASMQILDEARGVQEAAGRPRDGPARPPDGIQPDPHRRRRRPLQGRRHLGGDGRVPRRARRATTRRSTTRRSPSRTHPTCLPCTRCSAPSAAPTASGACPSSASRWPRRTPPCISGRSTSCSRRRPPRRPRGGRHRPAADRELPLHVRGPGQGRTVPGHRRGFAGNGGRVGARITLNDEGNGDRVVTSASALFRGRRRALRSSGAGGGCGPPRRRRGGSHGRWCRARPPTGRERPPW